MDKLVDHIFVFEGDGKIKDYNGNYTEYKQKKRLEEIEQRKVAAAQPKAKTVEKAPKADGPKLSYEERKEMNRLEKEVEKLEVKKAAIMDQFNSSSLDPNDIERLSKELNELNNTIEEKEMRWMELSELA